MSDTKKTAFFSNNFAEDHWKNKAQKNAFVLLGKQRFEEAAAFFLLANKLWDAVEVCVSNLNDFQLAFVVIRLYEGDHGPIYQRFLKEYILGLPATEKRSGLRLEVSPDPFLRSMVYWLLQDCSGALETLLVHPEEASCGKDAADGGSLVPHVFHTNPAIFNFYFYLRSHPLLVRRDHKTMTTTSFFSAQNELTPHKPSGKGFLSSVGDEPLTAVERGLLFSTAYYHLCHGCPLLVLNVLSRLPKIGKLGRDICVTDQRSSGEIEGKPSPLVRVSGVDSMAGMIESGTLANIFAGDGTKERKNQLENEEDFDWGAPVSQQEHCYGQEEEEIDWSKPLIPGNHLSGSEEFDWSQPISTSRQFLLEDSATLSPPNFNYNSTSHECSPLEEAEPPSTSTPSSSTLTPRGQFVLALAEQLQYNACLSIVTEELHSIYVPACCHFLWSAKGKAGLPILPLSKQSMESEHSSLIQNYSKNAFDRTVQNLRGMLTDWLSGEMRTVKEVCRVDTPDPRRGEAVSANHKEEEKVGGCAVGTNSVPSGYDLLTTLMNYTSLHAATSPSLLTVKFELMHLMNSLLPWSSGCDNPTHSHSKDVTVRRDTSSELVPTCAVIPSQLPVLTSCSLPVRHLTNLASHLRLLSGCILNVLNEHTYPPIASQPLPQVGKIFELCCAISHCITVSLNPMLLSDLSTNTPVQNKRGLTSSMGSLGRTPTPSSVLADAHQYQQQQQQQQLLQQGNPSHSPLLRQRMDSFNNLDSTIGTPNTKPAKWPGLSSWPQTLTSDEGRDPTPLSVVLVECLVMVYLGLFAAAWSQHSIDDLLVLMKNGPSMEMWYSCVGGGVDGKRCDRTFSRGFVSQTIESVSKKFRKTKPASSPSSSQEEEGPLGVFVAPKRTLLDHYLSVPVVEGEGEGRGRRRARGEPGSFLIVDSMEDDERESEEEGGCVGMCVFVWGGGGGGAIKYCCIMSCNSIVSSKHL